MSSGIDLKTVRVIKRDRRKLPSLRRHTIRAVALIALLCACVWLAVHFWSDPRDAVPTGEVGLDPVPLPPSSETLHGDSGALPDLLEGDVPPGANPTEQLDALGNPIDPSAQPDLVGGQTQTLNPSPQPRVTGQGPRTIMINGQPLEGSISRSPLPRAPIDGLSRKSPFGPVPTIASDGRKAVTSYARSFTPIAGKNSIALILGGLGIDQAMTRRAITELPPDVTLSFAAHAPNLQIWIAQARSIGHEVLLELPMESTVFDPSEPGAAYTLKTTQSAARNIRNLDQLMSKGQGYFAVTNYNGEKLVQRADVMAPILAHLSDAGLGLVYDGSAAAPSLPALAAAANLPYAQGFTLLDTVQTPAAMHTEFTRLEAQASSGRTPIGIGFAYETTIDGVLGWIATLPDKNLDLAPASYALGR